MNNTDISRKNKVVAYWLLTGVFMIVIQVLLGGVTRLTGSGLSITEWKPIMGTMPPLSEAEWQKAFEKYQGIAQYKYLNNHFTIGDFKFIFFWEWFHRLWARLLSVVFAIPFIYFLVKRYFNRSMVIPLVILFILGGLQGLIGWIMVDSGLNDVNLYVNHIKLSIHFISALVLLCYTLWFALQLLVPGEDIVQDKPLNSFLLFSIILLTIQLIYGAFMAGLKAAMTAPTWPTINGDWLPSGLAANSWINHPVNVHFLHRGLAYILFIVIIAGFVKVRKSAGEHGSKSLTRSAKYPLMLVVLQLLLGIFTVISAPKIVPGRFGLFESLAELHQLVAMFLLMSLIVQLYLVRRNKPVVSG